MNDESITLVMPWYPKGDLYNYAKVSQEKPLDEKFAQHICKQLVSTLI